MQYRYGADPTCCSSFMLQTFSCDRDLCISSSRKWWQLHRLAAMATHQGWQRQGDTQALSLTCEKSAPYMQLFLLQILVVVYEKKYGTNPTGLGWRCFSSNPSGFIGSDWCGVQAFNPAGMLKSIEVWVLELLSHVWCKPTSPSRAVLGVSWVLDEKRLQETQVQLPGPAQTTSPASSRWLMAPLMAQF